MTHALKTWPEYFKQLESDEKTFEIRKADRVFSVGDKVLLQEYDNERKQYTGNELSYLINRIWTDLPGFPLKKGFVILGLKEI